MKRRGVTTASVQPVFATASALRGERSISDISPNADPGASLTLSFRYRTNMSTGYGTASATRTGWFDKDPLQVTDNGGATNAAIGNFISASDAGNAAPSPVAPP